MIETFRLGDIVMKQDRRIFMVHRIEDGHLYGVEYGANTGAELDASVAGVTLIARSLEEAPIDEDECPCCGQMMRRA